MKNYPPQLRFGDLDSILKQNTDRTGRSVPVCIFKFTPLSNKDRLACQIFDGGTAYQMPQAGVAVGLRLVLRNSAMNLDDVKEGLMIELGADTAIHKLRSGEKVLDCYSCRVLGHWTEMISYINCVVNNPLALDSSISETVYSPSPKKANSSNIVVENENPKVFNQSSRTEGHNDIATLSANPAPFIQKDQGEKYVVSNNSLYKPEREKRQNERAEPYAQRNKASASVMPKQTVLPYLKIADLSQYVDKWRILARVTKKGDIKNFSSGRGMGKLFNIDLIDGAKTEIRGTFFNEAADRFYPIVEVDKVYSFSNGSIKPANVRFKRFPHPCEITFGSDAEIIPSDEGAAVPRQTLEPKPIALVGELNVGEFLDVIGVCHRIFATTSITIRSTGATRDKRNVIILDQSNYAVDVTLWGTMCSQLPQQDDLNMDIVDYFFVIKRAKIEEFNGRRLSVSPDSQLEIYAYDRFNKNWLNGKSNALLNALRDWYDVETNRTRVPSRFNSTTAIQRQEIVTTITEMLNACKEKTHEELTAGLYFSVLAGVQDVNVVPHKKFYWTACPHCGKKVTGGPDISGEESNFNEPYKCTTCDREIPEPQRKYIFTMDIQDFTNTVKVSVMGDVGETLIGATANEVEVARTDFVGERGFGDYFAALRRKEFVFRIQARNETWQDETRLRYVRYNTINNQRLMGLKPLEGETLLHQCRRYQSQVDGVLSKN